MARHAQTQDAVVRLTANEKTLVAEIDDRGRGADTEQIRRGFGIAGMRERAEMLGGRLTIASPPGGGTRITAEIPLS